MATVLAIDIGNTNTTVGRVEDGKVVARAGYLRENGARSNVGKAAEDFAFPCYDGIALTSVVPDLSPVWSQAMEQAFGVACWQLRHDEPLPIRIDYPKPETIGPDRLANAIAAWTQTERPVVIADFGTALTFDLVMEGGVYAGGVIAPGVELMYDYMAERTALLPKLEPKPNPAAIGKSTEEAMHSGAMYGYRGMVREIWKELQLETGIPDLPLFATGGFAGSVLQDFGDPVQIVPDLTMEGLAIAWQFASQTKAT